MARYAWVNDLGIVQEIIEPPAGFTIKDVRAPDVVANCHQCGDNVEQGWHYGGKGKGFQPPAPRGRDQITWEQARRHRDSLLARTDYMMMPDYPLDEAAKAQLLEYRKILRDLPQTNPDANSIDFEAIEQIRKRTLRNN